MGPPNKEVKAVFGQCKCCLKETYLKNMWEPLETKGNVEMYGQMLVDCFGINWSMQDMGEDNMCQACIAKLRVAVEFKKQILDSRATYAPKDGHVGQNTITVSEETRMSSITASFYYEDTLTNPLVTNDRTIKTIEDQDSINSMVNSLSNNIIENLEELKEVKTVPKGLSSQSILEFEKDNLTETLNNGNTKDCMKYNVVCEEKNCEDDDIIIKVEVINDETNEEIFYENEFLEEEFLEDDYDFEMSENESISPKRLRLNKSQRQYTDEDLNKALTAITSKKMSIENASEKYNVPVRTLKTKLRKKLDLKEYKSKKLPTRLRNLSYRQYTDDDLKKAIAAVRAGEMKLEVASETYQVPARTIRIKLRQKIDHGGRPDKFNMKEFFNVIRCIIQHTNATLFKTKGQKGYTCFFCPPNDVFYKDPEDLRNHTHSTHKFKEQMRRIELVMRPHYMNQMVRIDFHNLVCHCKEEVTWSILPEHLKTRHGLTNIKESWKKIIPYALQSGRASCVFPSCKFVGYFSQLEAHMNTHYPNFVCSICAKPLITEARLKMHEQLHFETMIFCEECKLVFQSRSAKAKHVNLVHKKIWLYNCMICEERFPTDTLKLDHLKTKHSHMIESHGRTCEECNETFWPSDYYKHLRKKHKKHICEVCGRKYDKQARLVKHAMKCMFASRVGAPSKGKK